MSTSDSTTLLRYPIPPWQVEAALYLSPHREDYHLRLFLEEEQRRQIAARLSREAEEGERK